MAVRIETGSEPIPGYKLIERLGGGGFGEVWKAEAPGGLFKAIKFVYGDLHAADNDDGARAEQELKAMSRVKTVHHPYIVSLERFDIIDGQLIIVMELADRTLWDRYKECRAQGMPGVPRDELLGYMQETAEALDLMNMQFQLQHLDIKPQNLFLIFNHIKVADFGLVKDLGNMGAATMTGGVTPVYAAPETFDGWLSRFSDQYSLAIVYQELLTGHRPFAGTTMRQLVLQHLQGTPDVSSLPANERPVILKALAKNPDDRFATCQEMILALRQSKVAVSPTPGTPVILKPSETASHVDSEMLPGSPTGGTGSSPENELDKTWSTRRRDGRPASHHDLVAPAPKTSPGQITPPNMPQRPPQRPTKTGEKIGEKAGEKPAEPKPAGPSLLRRAKAKPADPAATPSANSIDVNAQAGVIQPSVVIGLGNHGMIALMQLRRVLTQEFGHADAVPHIRLLGINTDGDTIRESTLGDGKGALRPHEFILARLHRPNHYVSKNRDGKLPTDSWFNSKLLYRINKENAKPAVRPIGRFAFVTNMSLIAKRIDNELQACCSQDTLHEMSKFTDLGVRSGTPRVYIIASLAGATGSGMFIDVAYLVRSKLRQMGHKDAEVVGIFYLPPVEREGIRSAPLANAHAALAELQYFMQHEGMRARYDTFDVREAIPFEESGPPFQRCVFMNLTHPRGPSDVETVPEAILESGQFLYRELATKLGKSLDASRVRHVRDQRMPGAHAAAVMETFGLYRIGWPWRDVQARLAERFCSKIVDRWRTKKADHLLEEITEWVGQQWDALGMRPENLIGRHQDLCKEALKATPEKIFQDLLAPAAQALSNSAKGASPKGAPPGISIGPVLTVMDQLEKLLGIPEQCRDMLTQRNMEPGTLERTLMEVSSGLADQCDQKLASIVVGLIEAPRYRLAGAEEALRRFNAVAEAALKAQEPLAKELSDRAAALYTRIKEHTQRADAALDSGSTQTTSATQWFGRNKNVVQAADILELLRVYPKAHFQAILLQCLNRLYISIRGHLSDQLREVGFCRQRLDELHSYVKEKTATTSIAAHVRFEKHLLPKGCKRLDDAVNQLETHLVEDDFLAFDDIVQAYIKKTYKALLNVCLGASGMVRQLAPVMLQEAESYLDQRFEPPSVADLLRSSDSPESTSDLQDIVRDLYEEATPDGSRSDEHRQIAAAALPHDDSGVPLAEAVAAALPNVEIVPSDRCEEIVIVREQFLRNLSELEQMGSVAQEAYRQRLAQDPTSLHSREDIQDWSPEPTRV